MNIDIFGDSAAWTRETHNANASIQYEDASCRVSVQEVTGAIDGNGKRIRVFEIGEAIRLDEDGDEMGFIKNVALDGLVRLPTEGQWALVETDDILSVSEVSALAEVGRQYVHDEIERKSLPARKVGKQYIIKGSDFVAWMSNPARGTRSKR